LETLKVLTTENMLDRSDVICFICVLFHDTFNTCLFSIHTDY